MIGAAVTVAVVLLHGWPVMLRECPLEGLVPAGCLIVAGLSRLVFGRES